VQGRYRAEVWLAELAPGASATLRGRATAGLGWAEGAGEIMLADAGTEGTAVHYSYEVMVGGKAAAIGGRLLDGAARVAIRRFFEALERRIGASSPLWRRALRRLLPARARAQ